MLPVMAAEPDDNALMLRYRAGDTVAFQRLYERHKGPLYRYFLRHCGDPDLAGDLFQDVWTKIIKARGSYESSARFTTYMYQIAHHRLVDHFRRQSRRPAERGGPVFDPEDIAAVADGDSEQAVMRQQITEQLRQTIAALPAEQRDAFLLREEAGLSLAEIAAVTGVPPETAKSRLRYAVTRLRALLVAQGAWP